MIKKNHLKNIHTFLGFFNLKSFYNLKLTNIKNACLILFINQINKNNLELGHWVSILIFDKNKKGNNNKKIVFLDSYGQNPKFYQKTRFNKYKKITNYLSIRLQGNNSTTCGAYSIFFIHIILKYDYDISTIQKIIRNIFLNNNYTNNDKLVIQYIYTYTNISKRDCSIYFCNKDFLLNYNSCIKSLCNK